MIEPTLEGKNATMFDIFNNEYSIVVKDDDFYEWYLVNRDGEIFLNDEKNYYKYKLKTYCVDQNGEVTVEDNRGQLWKMNYLGEKYKTDFYNLSIMDNTNYSCNSENTYYENKTYYCLNKNEEDTILFSNKNSFHFPPSQYFYNNNIEYDTSIGCETLELGEGKQIDENSYYILKNYRYIDTNGYNFFDGALFDSVTPFSKQGFASVTKGNKKYIIDTSGEIVYTLNDNENFLSFSNNDKVLLKFEEDRKIGLKNIEGKKILSPKYTYVSLLTESNGKSRYIVALEEKDGLVFKIIDENEDEISTLDDLKISLKEIEENYESLDSYFSWNINAFNNRLIAQDRYIYDCNGKQLLDLKNINENAYIIGPDPNLYYLYTERYE